MKHSVQLYPGLIPALTMISDNAIAIPKRTEMKVSR